MRDYAALEALAAKNSRLTDVFVRLGDQFVKSNLLRSAHRM